MNTDSVIRFSVQSIQREKRPDTSGDLFRLKPRWRYVSTQPAPPATEALLVINPNGLNGNINTFRLPRVWCEWLRVLNTVNGDDRAWRFIKQPHAGIFNATADDEWYEHGIEPTYNAVAFDGNVVKKKRVSGSWMFVETIRIDLLTTPPALDFFNAPERVHEFTAVNARGELSKPSNGIFVQCPLFSNQEVALPVTKLEPWTPDSPPLP